MLAAAGYLLEKADSFEQALQRVLAECPDLLVTPLRLGQFNGLHLALRCRAAHPGLPIIVTADAADDWLAGEAAEYNARFVHNTIAPEHFVTIVGELVRGMAAT
jgi:DNA-binding NtrC family response regulator